MADDEIIDFIEFITAIKNLLSNDNNNKIKKKEINNLISLQQIIQKQPIELQYILDLEKCIKNEEDEEETSNSDEYELYNQEINNFMNESEHFFMTIENCLRLILKKIQNEIQNNIIKCQYNFIQSDIYCHLNLLNEFINCHQDIQENFIDIIVQFSLIYVNNISYTSLQLNTVSK